MSSLREVIHAVLLADAAVTALIGAGTACRHYAERAPQGVNSAHLISNEVNGTGATTHGVPGNAEDTLDDATIQFTAWASPPAAAIALRKVVRASLANDAGGRFSAAGIKVTSFTSRFESADEIDLHGAQLDVTFFHNPQS